MIELTERSEQNQGAAGARRRAGRGYRDQTPTDLRGTDMIIRVRVTSLAWAAGCPPLAAAHGIRILPPARTLTTQARLPRGCPHQVLCEASQPSQHSQLLSRGRMTRPIMWVSCGPTCVVISVAAGKSAFSPQHAKWRQCRGPVWQTDRHLFQRRPR